MTSGFNNQVAAKGYSRVVAKGNTAMLKARLSYIRTRKLIAKGCIYHIVRFQDVDLEPLTLQSILVVNEFLDIFLDELSRIPPE